MGRKNYVSTGPSSLHQKVIPVLTATGAASFPVVIPAVVSRDTPSTRSCQPLSGPTPTARSAAPARAEHDFLYVVGRSGDRHRSKCSAADGCGVPGWLGEVRLRRRKRGRLLGRIRGRAGRRRSLAEQRISCVVILLTRITVSLSDCSMISSMCSSRGRKERWFICQWLRRSPAGDSIRHATGTTI